MYPSEPNPKSEISLQQRKLKQHTKQIILKEIHILKKCSRDLRTFSTILQNIIEK